MLKMRKIQFQIIIILFFIFTTSAIASASQNLTQKLSGRILLQVESKGEAWYVNQADQKRYYLGRPSDAFNIMKKVGLGVKHEIIINYKIYPTNFLGKILIDVEDRGKAYYINPANKKPYYLGKPNDAFIIMKNLSLGITDKNLNQIPIGELITTTEHQPTNEPSIMDQAATAIRSNDQSKVIQLFSPDMEKRIIYTLNYFNNNSRLMLANILSGSNLISSTTDEKIYSTKVYFSLGGYEVPVKFYVKKQLNETWALTNL